MKVLIATPYFSPKVGGLESYALNLALELHNSGWEVIIVTGDHVQTITKSTEHGLTIYRLPIKFTVSNTPINPAWPSMIRKIIRLESPDVINAHTPVPFMVDSVLLAAKATPVVITYHAASLQKPGPLAMRFIINAYLAWEKYILRRAKTIIGVSPFVAKALTRRFHRTVSVVSNAVNLVSAPAPAKRSGLVFVANLEPTHAWKGLDAILDALATEKLRNLTSAHLTVIGDGASKGHYEHRVESLGLQKQVTFTGQLAPQERDQMMNLAAALVAYPTTANDAFPTVFLEAWSLKLPIISAAIGPIPSIITNGVNGLLAAPNNPAKLSETIFLALQEPIELTRMGEQGRHLVETQLNWPTQAAEMSRILKEAI